MDSILDWLLEGDVSIQYQVYRDLLGENRPGLRSRIASEGWGARLLQTRKPDGDWGRAYYQPKWISTHYTLLDLKHLGIEPTHPQTRESVRLALERHIAEDGGINPAVTIPQSDVCLNGMFVNFAAYFNAPEDDLCSIVDFILSQQMKDGGFNCQFNQSGATHSSLHSTLSVLEGMHEYATNGYTYRLDEMRAVVYASREFMLQHRLFRSDRTGEVIDRRMLLLSYPSRWRYDILRALDYFRSAAVAYDPRMQEALDVLRGKRRKDGTWPLQGRHPGQTHFEMEEPGKPSRWNTLRALRVIRHFQ
jgi:hypothetical protein